MEAAHARVQSVFGVLHEHNIDGPSGLAARVRAVSDAYTVGRGRDQGPEETAPRVGAAAGGKDAMQARLRFFLVRDSAKVVRPLDELHARGWSPPSTCHVLDLGAGLGTTSLGLAGWYADRVTPERGANPTLHVHAVERDRACVKVAQRLLAHNEAMVEAAPSTGAHTPNAATEDERVQGARTFARIRLTTTTGDLRRLHSDERYDLILLGLVVNELAPSPEARADVLRSLIGRLRPGGAMIIVEPALRETSRALHALRDQLADGGDAQILAPCLHAEPCPMLQTKRDWCHVDRPVPLPDTQAKIARASGLRFERLTYAYLVLGRSQDDWSSWGAVPSPDEPDVADVAGATGATAGRRRRLRVVSQVLKSKGKCEWFGCDAAGRVRVTRLDRHESGLNGAFDEVQRGDMAILDAPTSKGAGLRVDERCGVTRALSAVGEAATPRR